MTDMTESKSLIPENEKAPSSRKRLKAAIIAAVLLAGILIIVWLCCRDVTLHPTEGIPAGMPVGQIVYRDEHAASDLYLDGSVISPKDWGHYPPIDYLALNGENLFFEDDRGIDQLTKDGLIRISRKASFISDVSPNGQVVLFSDHDNYWLVDTAAGTRSRIRKDNIKPKVDVIHISSIATEFMSYGGDALISCYERKVWDDVKEQFVTEGHDTYIWQDGQLRQLIGNMIPVSISDDLSYMYLTGPDKVGLYVKKADVIYTLDPDIRICSCYSNLYGTQLLVRDDEKTYLSIDGGPLICLGGGEGAPLAYNTVSNPYNKAVGFLPLWNGTTADTAFTDTLIRVNESTYCWVDKQGTVHNVGAASDEPLTACVASEDCRTFAYTVSDPADPDRSRLYIQAGGASGDAVPCLLPDADPVSLYITPDGHAVYWKNRDGSLYVWMAADNGIVRLMDSIHAIYMTADGTLLAEAVDTDAGNVGALYAVQDTTVTLLNENVLRLWFSGVSIAYLAKGEDGLVDDLYVGSTDLSFTMVADGVEEFEWRIRSKWEKLTY